jgi:hypothetical protein
MRCEYVSPPNWRLQRSARSEIIPFTLGAVARAPLMLDVMRLSFAMEAAVELSVVQQR